MRASHCIAWVLIVACLAAAATHLYMASRPAAVGKPPAETQPATGRLIATSQPAVRSFAQKVPWIGTVQSRLSVQLTALTAGRVEAIEAGDQAPVEGGAVVMRLGGPQVTSQRAQRQARIDSLKSQLALAGQTVKRLGQDLKDQLATKDQLAAAQEAQLKLRGQLQEAEGALKLFDERLVISAGMAGMFTDRRVSVGQALEAGAVVGEVIDPNHVRIAASLFPPEAEALEGKAVTVRLSAQQALPAVIRHVLPQAAATGATQVWIEGPQIDRQFKPGQTVSGTVTIDSAPSALAVPASAIVYDAQERPHLFVREGGTYRQRSVELGIAQDGWVQVLSGVSKRESVVTQGAYELYYRQFSQQFKVED